MTVGLPTWGPLGRIYLGMNAFSRGGGGGGGGGAGGSEAPFVGGPFRWGPLDMCPVCPAVNPALKVHKPTRMIDIPQERMILL